MKKISLVLALAAPLVASAFEKIALVDSFDFYDTFDTESATGVVCTLDHVLSTGADTVLWRNCGGGTMRYQTAEDPVLDGGLEPLRLPSSARYAGWLNFSKSEPDRIRQTFDYLDSKGVGRGIHWPFEENHHNCWTLSGWNLHHPQYWCRNAEGRPWAGRCSLAYPEVVAHKLRLLDELIERGTTTVLLDTHHTGQWEVRDEFVEPVLAKWRAETGGTTPAIDDPRFIAIIAENNAAYLRQVKARLCAGGRKGRLYLGLDRFSLSYDRPYRTFALDWKKLAAEGVVDGLFLQSADLPKGKDVWAELEKVYRHVYVNRGKAKVYFPVMQYSWDGHNGYPWFAKTCGISELEAVRRLLSLAASCGGSGIFMECVDWYNYKDDIRAAIRDFRPTSARRAPWTLETPPLGGVTIDDTGALSREALSAKLDEIAAVHREEPYVVTRAKGLVAMLDHVRLAANTNDLFVHWHPDGRLLDDRRKARVDAFRNAAPDEREPIGRGFEGTKGAWVVRLDQSHTCPDWESVLALGPKGLADRARRRLATARNNEERVFLSCVIEIYEGMSRFCRRWSESARRLGMNEVADVLREIADHPPRTFREALQLSLIYDRVQEDEDECVRSQGLFDRLFIGFYRADLAAGRLTRAQARRLVRGLYDCYYNQNHPNCKNIAFGGYDEKGEVVWNELTEIGFEVHREANRPNPKLTFRYGAKTPRRQLETVARCLAEGRTSVVFGIEESLERMFLRQGKDREDVASAVLIGCYEPGIQGRDVIASMAVELNLTRPLEAVFNNGCDFRGRRIGPPSPLPADGEGFERAYLVQLGAMAEEALSKSRLVERNWYELNPSPAMSGASRDCIEKALDATRGGCKYNQSGVVCAGLATVVDSLMAVRHLVDTRRLVTMSDLSRILQNDWKGYEELRLIAAREAPKWGAGDAGADDAGCRIFDFLAPRINAAPNGHGGFYQAGFWSIDRDIPAGYYSGATPDGRHAGEPISRNNSATAGCGREGPTALLASISKLDQANAPDGLIADVILPVGRLGSDHSTRMVADVLSAYAAMGGQCIHINTFDAAMLEDAMAHPEMYPDLQVRVCGWNVRWNDLSKKEQVHFLKTARALER